MAKADHLVESLPEGLKLELERLEDETNDLKNVVDFPMKYYTYNAQNQLKFNCHLVKDEILEEQPIYRSDIGILLYENGVYKRVNNGDIKHIIQKKIGEEATIHRKQETLDLILHENKAIPLAEFNKKFRFLNVQNGIYSLSGKTFQKHLPSYKTTIQLPINYDPEAKCPAILEFLHDILDEDGVQFVIEWLAYMCLPYTDTDKIVILHGNGGNGKSALLNIFSHFLGTQNITHMTLHEIADDKFMKAQLYGKLANICGDIDSKAINNTGIIKNLTGVEPIQAQFKGIDSFSFQSFAKLMFSANDLPKTIDKTNGWFRRWFIIPFEKSIPEEKKMERSELDKRLTNPKELSGLLNLVLEAVKKLEKSGYKFTIPEASKKAIDEYQLASDDLAQFIHSHCEINKDRVAKVKWTHFYHCYKSWFVDENNELPDSKKIIKERLAEKGFKVEIGAGNNFWLMGLSFKENSEYFKR